MTTDDTWPELIRRLDAIGGELLDSPLSRWGSREILAPAGHYDKRIWVVSGALASLLEEWEAAPERYGPRLAVWLEALSQKEQSDASDR